MVKRGENILGYTLSSESTRTFTSFSPSNGECSGWDFHCATENEIIQACKLAASAFRHLQSTSYEQRALFLRTIDRIMAENSSSILEMYVLESGLNIQRGQQELERTLKQLRSFSDLVYKNEWIEASIDPGDQSLEPPLHDVRKMRIGIGPVVVFGASNFPLAYSTAGGDTVSALAAGCPVIVKAHPLHPATSHKVAECILRAAKECDMPDGIFSHLFDDGFEVGKMLVLNKEVKAVGFTGSLNGGRELFNIASARPEPIPVFAEMGSLNPMFLLELKNFDAISWAKRIAASITSDSGQFCTKPGLIFMLESEGSTAFTSELVLEINTALSGTMLTGSIQEHMKKKVTRLAEHYRIVAQGIESQTSINQGVPILFELNTKDFLENIQFQEEIFGPAAFLVHCKTVQEILTCANWLSGQLTASIIGVNDVLDELCFILRERVGRIVFNGVPTGVRVCPSMNHGGPYPASTEAGSTAVGIDAIKRFSRFITYQNFDQELLPVELRNENELNLFRRVNGELTKASI